MDGGDRIVFTLLLLLVTLINGSVASEEPQLLGIVLAEELNVEEEKAANVSSEDFPTQETTVGYQVEEESSTLGVTQTTSLRELNTVTPTMDLITIIWYVATLIALISFFVVMACADTHRCFTPKPPDVETPVPPTPAPSYRLFAPPSYESVIQKRPESIFIIPIHNNSSSQEQFTEGLIANLSNVIEPTATCSNGSNAQSESTDSRDHSHRSENISSVTV